MALRLMELVLPADEGESLPRWLEGAIVDLWQSPLDDGRNQIKILVEPEHTEEVLDKLDQRFRHLTEFRVIVLTVDIALPKPVKEDKDEAVDQRKGSREVSRQELLGKMQRATRVTSTYITMLLLSVVVAAIGLIYDNIAVLIAAMIIAPLLGANMALALATTTGDGQLARNAVKVNLTGFSISLVLAVLLGWVLQQVDPQLLLCSKETLARTRVHVADFALALASGAAGTMAFTTGVSGTLIGVMVAVALMPPLLVVGMMLGAGEVRLAIGAALLLSVNLICLNLAAVVTFLAQGVRPTSWWKAKQTSRATWQAVFIWAMLAVALVIVVVLISYRGGFALSQINMPTQCR